MAIAFRSETIELIDVITGSGCAVWAVLFDHHCQCWDFVKRCLVWWKECDDCLRIFF